MAKKIIIYSSVVLLIAVSLFLIFNQEQYDLPEGEAVQVNEDSTLINEPTSDMKSSTKEVFVTDGVKHSIQINEILSGGPPKDGIPSIDDPKFISADVASGYLTDDSPGLGLFYKGEARFYPYQIMVWHELANDTVAGDALLISYCPLCVTGIVFDRNIDGVDTEFGVSGKLWRSNLLMYNRAEDSEDESLWSQVLAEAVVGKDTGRKLTIVQSDAVLFGDWKKKHSDTKVLSKETGASRSYGSDPYDDYYTNESVSFGATFNDDRLHPKSFVLGIEINGSFKAYEMEALKIGITTDTLAGSAISIEKTSINEIRMFVGEEKTPLSYIGGFWFSWLAVHPNTELYK